MTDGAKVYAKDLVRVSSDTQKIDKFFQVKATKQTEEENASSENTEEKEENDEIRNDIKEKLDNIENLNGNAGERKKVTIANEIEEIPEVVDASEEDADVLESSLVHEPREENRSKDKWSFRAGADQANVTYIDPKDSFKTRTFQYERVETKLTSVKRLRMDVEDRCSMNLREVLANLIFIACIDRNQSLIQHSTKLYLCNTTKLT